MVQTQIYTADDPRPAGHVGRIILRPNNSMGWRATRAFLITLMGVSFSVAAAFTLHGYWVILPFTALEMGLVGAALYYVVRRNYVQEVLTFTPDEVLIQVGRDKPKFERRWQRFFTKIMVHPPKHPWYPNRVALRCRNEEWEIGQFLTIEDKQALVRDLRALVRAADECRSAV